MNGVREQITQWRRTDERERMPIEKRKGQVEVKWGRTAILLAITRDDSDPMTDYFASHVTVKEWLLADVAQQPETQLLARWTLSRCIPEIRGLSYTWHREKWAGGHGNYLRSEPVANLATRGNDKVNGCYEVQFRHCYRDGMYFTPRPDLEKPYTSLALRRTLVWSYKKGSEK